MVVGDWDLLARRTCYCWECWSSLLLVALRCDRQVGMCRHINCYSRQFIKWEWENPSSKQAPSYLRTLSMSLARQTFFNVMRCCHSKKPVIRCKFAPDFTPPTRSYHHNPSARQLQRRSGAQSIKQNGWIIRPRARRRFSTSPMTMHGHIDPPKPGEE